MLLWLLLLLLLGGSAGAGASRPDCSETMMSGLSLFTELLVFRTLSLSLFLPLILKLARPLPPVNHSSVFPIKDALITFHHTHTHTRAHGGLIRNMSAVWLIKDDHPWAPASPADVGEGSVCVCSHVSVSADACLALLPLPVGGRDDHW